MRYYPSNMIHTSPHIQGLSGVTQSAFVEAAAMLEWNDASLVSNVENLWTLMKERILCFRDRFVTIGSYKRSNRTPWLKSRDMGARQMKHTAYQQNSQNPYQLTLNVYQA